MPFFVPRTELDQIEQLKQTNALMAERLLEVEGMRPIIELAHVLRDEFTTILDTHPELSTQAIGELAFRGALEDQISRARDELVADYEQVHRSVLYDRVLEQVTAEEGDDIAELVRLQVETDPELAIELRDSARRELAARAMDEVKLTITSDQQAVIDAEAERQIALDRLDVTLAKDGVLYPQSDRAVGRLQPGDTVRLYLEPLQGETREVIEYRWDTDVHGVSGWFYAGASKNVQWRDQDGSTTTPSTTKFASLSTLHFDGSNGKNVAEENCLRTGMQPILGRTNPRNGRKFYLYPYVKRRNSYGSEAAVLSGSDFRTKSLHFYSGR